MHLFQSKSCNYTKREPPPHPLPLPLFLYIALFPIDFFSSLFHIKGHPFISPKSMSGNGIIFIKHYYQHNEQLSYFLIYLREESESFLKRTKEHFLPNHPCHIYAVFFNRKFLLRQKRDRKGGGGKVVSCCCCLLWTTLVFVASHLDYEWLTVTLDPQHYIKSMQFLTLK